MAAAPCRRLLAIQSVRWRVSFLTLGIINVFCWPPNYAMQLNVLSIFYNESVHRKEQLGTRIKVMATAGLNIEYGRVDP